MIRWKSVVVSTAALALAALAVATPARAQSSRPTVAILDLDYAAIQHWWEGNWDIGKGVADLIVDGLVEDGSFRVIERKRLDAILAEQNFSSSDRADPSAASVAKIGKALGVKYLLVGSITKFGTEKSPGTRLMSVSGNVKKPGVYEVELGKTFRHVIMELAGGPPDGRKLKVFWPGGSSAPVLPESMLDTHTDMEALAAARSMGGSGGVIAMDDSHCIVRAASRLLKFYSHESCGKCTPCRVGSDWAVRTYDRILAGEASTVELGILERVSDGLQNGRCLCGLGDSAGWVIDSTLRHFRSEYDEHCLHNVCSVEGAALSA